MKTKICTKCSIKKDIFEFSKNRADCKKCKALYDIEYRKNNKLKLREKRKKYYIKNKKKLLKRNKRWRIINSLKYKKSKQKYYLKTKEKHNKQTQQYYKIHKNDPKFQKTRKNYRIKNKKKLNKQIVKIHKNQYKTNIRYRILSCLRNRIWKALKGNVKSLSTMFLIGCEIDYFMYHIQSQFSRNMTWNNYGLWHIDHKLPCASFDLSKPSEQRKCFNYTNLQPLWQIDNQQKHTKLIEIK